MSIYLNNMTLCALAGSELIINASFILKITELDIVTTY